MWEVPEKFKVKIGGNYFIDTPNLIVAHGESLFKLERRDDGLLGVDFDIYESDSSKIATIRHGNVVQGNSEKFEIKKEYHHYWINERSSGRLVCDIKQRTKAESDCELEVSVNLYTKSGFHLIAGPEETNIGGNTIRGCTMEKCGAGIAIT